MTSKKTTLPAKKNKTQSKTQTTQAKPKTQISQKKSPSAITQPRTLKSRIKHLALASLCVLVGSMLFLMLISSTTTDLSSQTNIVNIFGIFGAYISNFLFMLFGLSSFIFAILILLFGLFIFFGKQLEVKPSEVIGHILMIFSAATLLQLHFPDETFFGHPSGGFLGSTILFFLQAIIPKTQYHWITITSSLILFASILLVTSTKPSTLLKALLRFIKFTFKALMNTFKKTSTQKLQTDSNERHPNTTSTQQITKAKHPTPKEDSVELLIAENDKMPESLLIAEQNVAHTPSPSPQPPKKRITKIPSASGFKPKTKIPTSSGTTPKIKSIVSNLLANKAKRRKHPTLPPQEPDFEFDSIVPPEKIKRASVLSEWTPRTLKRKSKTKYTLSTPSTSSNSPKTTTPIKQTSPTPLPQTILLSKNINTSPNKPSSEQQNQVLKPNTAPRPISNTPQSITSPKQQPTIAATPNLTPKNPESIFKDSSNHSIQDITLNPANLTKVAPPSSTSISATRDSNEKIASILRKSLSQKNTPNSTPKTTTPTNNFALDETVTPESSPDLQKLPPNTAPSQNNNTPQTPPKPTNNNNLSENTAFVVAEAKHAPSENEILDAEKKRIESLKEAKQDFQLPPLSLLNYVPTEKKELHRETLKMIADKIETKLADYRVKGKVTQICPGPVVTCFEFLPAPGTKVATISSLADDLQMALEVHSIRVIAPIPGKGVVGIEIPNEHRETVYIKEILASPEFTEAKSPLTVALGKDIEANAIVSDLAKMPHLLIAGSTGSGKSVAINTIICSLLYNASPKDLRLIMVDPKRLELSIYNGIPHLLLPPITDPPKVANALQWACMEMEHRYDLMAEMGVRNIKGYNEKIKSPSDAATKQKLEQTDEEGNPKHKHLPYIVIIIDELADLMMVAQKDVEPQIIRLAQMARACGIHLIIATQRPSVDVITGLIKANFPTRLAFRVFSRHDSKTILDANGAEALLGMGDSLFLPPSSGMTQRVHGAFVSDKEVQAVVDFLCEQAEPDYDESIADYKNNETADAINEDINTDNDPRYEEARSIVISAGQASSSMLQRKMGIGFNRAARIIDELEENGVIGPPNGSKPREVLISSL